MKVIDQLVVERCLELQPAQEAGHAEQFGAHGEACDGGDQRKLRRRENAGRSRQIAFHQGIHSDIGPTLSLVLTNDVRYPAIAVTPLILVIHDDSIVSLSRQR